MCPPFEPRLDHDPRDDEHLIGIQNESDVARRSLNRQNHLQDFLETLNNIKYDVSFDSRFEDDNEGISERSKAILTTLAEKCLHHLHEALDTNIEQFVRRERSKFPSTLDKVEKFMEFIDQLTSELAALPDDEDDLAPVQHDSIPNETAQENDEPTALARFHAMTALSHVSLIQAGGEDVQASGICPYGIMCPDVLEGDELKCQRIAAHRLVFAIYLCARALSKIHMHPDLNMAYLCDITEEMNFVVLDLCASLDLLDCLPEINNDMDADEYAMSVEVRGEYNAEEEDSSNVTLWFERLTQR